MTELQVQQIEQLRHTLELQLYESQETLHLRLTEAQATLVF